PTGSRTFGGTDYGGADEVADEHIYWDQASLLVQIGLLDAQLPAGRRTAKIVPFEEDDAPYLQITNPLAGGPCVACAPSGRPQCPPPASLCSWVWENRAAGRAVPLPI